MQVFLDWSLTWRGIILEGLVVAVAAGILQLVNRLRIEQVELAVRPPLVLSAGIQHMPVDLPVGKGLLMARLHFARDHVQADRRRRATPSR